MKLLRLKLFQETACYLNPFAYKVGETFPLAPFSTVKGMLHAVLGATEYLPMNLSIQGQSESFIIDYQKKFMYKKAEVPQLVSTDGLLEAPEHDKTLYTTMPMYQHLLYNVEHIIHVEAEQSVLQELYEKFNQLSTVLSMGRWEDLVRIDEVCFVGVENDWLEEVALNQYVPIELEGEFFLYSPTAYYRLPRKYDIRDGRRSWDYLLAVYIPKSTLFDEEAEVLTDGEYSIFLMKG